MKKTIFLFLFCLTSAGIVDAQDCRSILNQAKAAYSSGNLKQALKKLQDTEICDINNELRQERQTLQSNIFKAIDDQRIEAENNARKVQDSEKATQIALRAVRIAYDSLHTVLEDLEKSSAECAVRLLLAEVERSQRELKFDVAVEKVKTAKTLGVLTDSVNAAYQNLSEALLRNAAEDLQRKQYRYASAKIKSAGELNVQPESVAAANRELQHILIKNARLDIMNSDYGAAGEKMNVMDNLSVSPDTVAAIRFEIAFCYTETDRLDRAGSLLDTIARMRNNGEMRDLLSTLAGKSHKEQLQVLRQVRQQLDPEANRILTDRYLNSAFVQIPGGNMSIGGTQGGCPVSVKPFSLASKELTFFEYDLFCSATNRPGPADNDWGRGMRPAININWYDAVEYCNWRSRKEGLQEVYTIGKNSGGTGSGARNDEVLCNWSANGYRLPTETEWEFAAGNGGKQTRYSWGEESPADQQVGNVADETARTKFPGSEIFTAYTDGFVYTAPAGSYRPNHFGLYDMTGNVLEWCWDWYDENYCRVNKNRTDPQGPSSGTDRIMRGGYWLSPPKDCQVSNRFFSNPNTRKVSIGFRLAKN